MLRCRIQPDHETASRFVADWMIQSIRGAASPLLCVASGSTPTRAYQLFAEALRREPEALATLRVIKLDEWLGPDEGSDGTCEEHLRRVLVDPLRLGDRYIGFRSSGVPPAEDCRRIGDWLAAEGPVDCCVLGLGMNGHLGFNEPAASLWPHSHVAELSATSLGHAMVRDAAVRPYAGVTLGMADLLQSRRIVVIATGRSKRAPVERLMEGRIATDFPASLLHIHPDATLVIDQSAASSAEQ